MSAYELPSALVVGGISYEIRTDYRAVLDILKYCSDPEYEPDEQALIILRILYKSWDSIPHERYDEAIKAACDFIDMGIPHSDGKHPRVMDWEQDAPIIIPAVNHVLGQEIRALPYMHWWTFLSAYLDVGEGLLSSVIYIRQKKAKGKPLEKHEKEFARENKALIELKKPETEAQREEKDRLLRILDGE